MLVAFGLWIRLKLEDTPVFLAIKESGERPKAPIKEVFATQKRALLAAALARVGPDVLYALFTVFVATYATTVLGMTRSQVLTAVLIGSAVPAVPDPAGRGAVATGSTGGCCTRSPPSGRRSGCRCSSSSWPARPMPLLVLGIVIGLAFHAFMYGPQAAYITEQFDIHLRYAGSSLAYTLAGVVGGAIAPLVFTALLGWSGSWVPIALYLAGCVAVTLVGLALGRDPQPTRRKTCSRVRRAAPDPTAS